MGVESVSLANLVALNTGPLEKVLKEMQESVHLFAGRLAELEKSGGLAPLITRLDAVESDLEKLKESASERMQELEQRINEHSALLALHADQIASAPVNFRKELQEREDTIVKRIWEEITKVLWDKLDAKVDAKLLAYSRESGSQQQQLFDDVIAKQETTISNLENQMSSIEDSQKSMIAQLEACIASIASNDAEQKEAVGEIRKTFEEHAAEFSSMRQKLNDFSELEPVIHSHTDLLGKCSTMCEHLERDLKSHTSKTERELAGKIDMPLFETTLFEMNQLRQMSMSLRDKFNDVDTLRCRIDTVEEALMAHGQPPDRLQAQLDHLQELMKHFSGGATAAGHCVSCSMARTSSPNRHTVGNDGKIYNARDERGRVDMSSSDMNAGQQRPMSQWEQRPTSASAIVRRNPHPAVQSAALASMAMARSGQFVESGSNVVKRSKSAVVSS